MNIHAVPPIVAALAFLLIGFFVYYRKKPDPANRSFFFMLVCVSVWNMEWAVLTGVVNPDSAHWWGNIFRIGLLFIPPAFLHFTLHFTHPQGFHRRSRNILLVFYLLSCFFSSINWTREFHGELVSYRWGYYFQSGPLYWLFGLQFASAILISFYYMIQGYILADSYRRHRLKYFFLSIGLGFALGSWNFLPKSGLQPYPLGSIAVTAGLLLAAYSVVQHRLIAVSVFMAKGVSYILSFAAMAVPVFLLLLFLEEFFYHDLEISFAVIVVLISAGAILIFNFTKVRADRAMRQMIVRDKYKYHQMIEEFSRHLATIVDLNRLLNMLADTIEKSMGVKQISLFLKEPEKEVFRARLIRGSAREEVLNLSTPAMQYLQEKKDAILLVDLEQVGTSPVEKEIKKDMIRLQAEVCLPLIYMNRLIGVINLGPKVPEEMYYLEDLELLYPLANQVAVAIENSNLYENLKKSQNIMRRADRLASLGTLIASLAHEIRNPLVSIKTFTQLLPERIEDEEFRNYFLKVASGEIDRLTSLINELLGFARPSEPRLEGEDVNVLIDKMEVLIATEARKKNVALQKNYSRELPNVKVDAEQLKQVLLNILLNAIQAIKGEGKIWIETRTVRVPIEEKVEPFIQIEVRDTGVGIPKENLERIFDPFFSTRAEGSGLGLAISHQIIHDHGGFISVESEVGKGTSFKIHLPLKPGGKSAEQG